MVASATMSGYSVMRYRSDGGAFLHVLHGHVPGHQIDFIYAPEVPQGGFTPTHYSHLTRLVKYVEPQPGARYAFAIANLSRDDTQFEPGRGAMGLILGLRIEGAVDHTGRVNPPFAHAIAGVDRAFTEDVILEAATTFFRHILSEAEVERATREFYQNYVQCAVHSPSRLDKVLGDYVGSFEDLPDPERSAIPWTYKAPEVGDQRILIVHDDDEPFLSIATAAARIAAALYKSDVRWTQITTGGERDVPGGVTVRFVMRQNAHTEGTRSRIFELADLPREESAIARELFGAEVVRETKMEVRGWREKFGQQAAPDRESRSFELPHDDDLRSARFQVPEAITRVAGFETTGEDTGVGGARPREGSNRPPMMPSMPPLTGVGAPPMPRNTPSEGRLSLSNWPASPAPSNVDFGARRSSMPHPDMSATAPKSRAQRSSKVSSVAMIAVIGILLVTGVAVAFLFMGGSSVGATTPEAMAPAAPTASVPVLQSQPSARTVSETTVPTASVAASAPTLATASAAPVSAPKKVEPATPPTATPKPAADKPAATPARTAPPAPKSDYKPGSAPF